MNKKFWSLLCLLALLMPLAACNGAGEEPIEEAPIEEEAPAE
jgi:predicted small lipoprotein YifL